MDHFITELGDGDLLAQEVCPCCKQEVPEGCPMPTAAAGPEPCPVEECRCIGIKSDAGLCWGCYLFTK